MFFRHPISMFILSVLCYSLNALVQPEGQCQPADSLGFLKIESDSLHLEIRLNNKPLGFTPLPILALPTGKYHITASHPKRFIWGNLDWQDSIMVAAHETLIIRPQLKPALTVRTNPFDAAVYLNGELLGHTPITIPIDPASNKLLVIKMDGFQEQTIPLNEIRSDYLQLDLLRNQTNWESTQMKFRQQRLSKKYYRTVSYSLWGLSILTGFTTVYFKERADNYYQQYLVAGSMQQMNRYYNDARRFDRYTYISLATLQACFGLSFYFLLKSLD